jgi:hypothetical protein
MEKAHEETKNDVNSRHYEPEFEAGYKVLLKADNIPLDRPSRKLGHQNIGLYLVLKNVC